MTALTLQAVGARPNTEDLRKILHGGLLAPSAENKHCVQFRPTTEGGVDLLSTDVASWGGRPHRRFLALMAVGAMVENMTLRAGELEWSQSTQWWPDPTCQPELVARLSWSSAVASPEPLAAAMSRRHTNRQFYWRAVLPAQTLARLRWVAEAVPGVSLLWLDEPSARSLVLQALRLAETERFRRQALHEELFDAIRFEVGWETATSEWLPPGALEIEPPMRAMFSALRHWPLMRAATYVGLHHVLGLRAGDLPSRFAPHIGMLVVDGPAETRALEGGRALQRTWLAATDEGLGFQPMAAAVALTHQRAGNGWVSAAVQARLKDFLRGLKVGIRGEPMMIFRTGGAKPPTLVTQRLPVDHYLAAH